MNILHLIDEPYDSGIVHYALTLAKGLQDNGHSVCVGGIAGAYPLEEARRLGLETSPIRHLPAALLDLRRVLRQKRIQILNAHTGSSHALAVAAAKISGMPVQIIRTRGDSRPLRITVTSKILWRRTAGFIAPTERILSDFKRIVPGRAIDARAVLPGLPSPTISRNSREPESPPYRVGLLGRLDPIKGHGSFLRAAARVLEEIPETAFMIAGREENVKISELRRLAEELKIGDRIHFLGHVPDAWHFMRKCHVGVVASVGSEAISRAAIEWMSVGKPIVATGVGSLPEIVNEGKTGFVVPADFPEAMAHRLIELLKNPVQRARMGAEALKQFEARFSLNRFVKETETFYEDTIRRFSPR